ncbi:RDD family protein [Oceanospirillum sanctuarii]|uniref:RDD family protein n=1 Tax=Oceanospirillum sanctuarii TaxID=1434821 RepID=UPI000A3CB7F9|nr:RDD family protein [Oceanospirillum sanctuarii]
MNIFRLLLLQLEVRFAGTRFSGLLTRLVALLIDYLVLTMIFTFLLIFTGNNSAELWSGKMEAEEIHTLLFLTVVVFFLVNSKLLFDRGQSVGKMMMALRIVSTDGEPVSRKQILKRFAFYWLLWLIPVYGIFLALSECLYALFSGQGAGHDKFAGTKVVVTDAAIIDLGGDEPDDDD